MGAQINITKGTSLINAPSGKMGLSFDSDGNLIKIDEFGNITIVGTGQISTSNIIAELGLGLEENLPAITEIGDSYVTTDTFKVFTVKDAITWDSSDLEKGQFVLDTSATPILYQFDGVTLQLLQALETTESILLKIGDGSIISAIYLPSFVDDVVEVANFAALPGTGETGKIYVTIDTSLSYRWSGTVYVQITPSPTYASQSESETGTENTKVMTALRVAQSWIYQIGNYVVSALNTTSKTIVGAINELLLKFVGVYNDRGYFDASIDAFPSTGGSGSGGAILQGDCFTISNSGTAAGVILNSGIVIRALQDTPGQIANNWYVPSFTIGYTPENVDNKELVYLDTSTDKYPCNAVVKTNIDTLQQEIDNLATVQANPIYYLENMASDIATYEQLLRAPITISEVTEAVVINNNTVAVDKYATNAGEPGVTSIPAGAWTMHAHVEFSTITGENYLHFDVYKRNLAGTETFLFRISSEDITSTGIQEIQVTTIQDEVTGLAETDRLVVEVLFQTTGTSKTATFHYGGTTTFAFIQTPPISTASLATLVYVNSSIIYTPTTQPVIAVGTPNTLTVDCNSREQVIMEPRDSVGTRTISSDFTLAFSNTTNTKIIHLTLSLTGTRIITMPSGTLVSNPSSIGEWDGTDLTLSTATDDIIELSFLRDVTGSKWKLIVGEANV